MKKIDINSPVADQIDKNPNLKEDLINIGFKALANPAIYKSMAKKISIKRGSKMMGIKDVENSLRTLGYEIYDSSNDAEVIDRKEKIKSYIIRLSNGEDIKEVRSDFKANFDGVSSSEIMDAEESLLEEGMDKEEVRRLCDVHSALFHGMTTSEEKKETEYKNPFLNYFADENKQIETLVNDILDKLSNDSFDMSQSDFKIISDHYRKKGDLIYPILKDKYDKSGPSEVMWAVDKEISLGIKKSLKAKDKDLLKKAMERAKEMTYKENNILYPLVDEKLIKEDYHQLYKDLMDYDSDLLDKYPWESIEIKESNYDIDDNKDGYINFSKGKLRIDQLEALLDTLEIEITFVDENDMNAYYNDHDGEKIFKRPVSSLGREVYSCHPPQVEPKVRKFISDFKANKRDKVQIIRNIGGKDYSVCYYAVRDKDGNYKGVLETVQDMSFYTEYQKKYRW